MSTPTFRHGLGDRVRDRISGFVGIITSRSEHLFGCARYWVSPQEHKDGEIKGGVWFDEDAIEVVEAAVIQPQQYRVVHHVTVVPEASTPLQRAGGPASQPSSHTQYPAPR